MNAPVVAPRLRYASKVTRFANPPTKKKMGITWRNHVASHSHAVTPIALVDRMEPLSQIDHRDRPVADHHRQDAHGSQEVDVAIPGRRGSVGQVSQACRHDPS